MATEKDVVKLKTKDANGKDKDREFPVAQANKLLQLAKPQWELADKAWKWNGEELTKA